MNESASDSYAMGYQIGRTNAETSGQAVIGVRYMPTAAERAQSINFKGDDQRRLGWLAGWADGAVSYREFQARELGVTNAEQWRNRT